MPPAPSRQRTGKTRGAQPGHKTHLKSWLPAERVSTVETHVPQTCSRCDRPLADVPNEPSPTIHQVAELPNTLAEITEHRGCARVCPCGYVTRAAIPADVRAHTLGPKLIASIVDLSGVHGMSKRGIEETVETLFGVPIPLSTAADVEREVGEVRIIHCSTCRKSPNSTRKRSRDKVSARTSAQRSKRMPANA